MSSTNPHKARLPPAGVQRTVVSHVRPRGVGMAPPEDLARVDNFLTNPLVEGGVKGFTEVPFPSALTQGMTLVASQLVNKRRKTFVAAVCAGNVSDDDAKHLFVVMRGDRKQSGNKFFTLDKLTRLALASSLFSTMPSSAASYHPWFSSVVYMLTRAFDVCHENVLPLSSVADLVGDSVTVQAVH